MEPQGRHYVAPKAYPGIGQSCRGGPTKGAGHWGEWRAAVELESEWAKLLGTDSESLKILGDFGGGRNPGPDSNHWVWRTLKLKTSVRREVRAVSCRGRKRKLRNWRQIKATLITRFREELKGWVRLLTWFLLGLRIPKASEGVLGDVGFSVTEHVSPVWLEMANTRKAVEIFLICFRVNHIYFFKVYCIFFYHLSHYNLCQLYTPPQLLIFVVL